MNRYLATGLMIAGVIGAAVFAAPRMVRAQQGNGGPHVIVVNDVMHVVGPPLRGERPIPPAVGLNRNIPLRHPVPLQSAVNVAPDPVLQTSIQPLVSATNGLNFLGVGVGLNGISGDSYIPPDTNGAVGDTQYVQWVNASFAVFDKSTGNLVYGPSAGNMFWQKLGGVCAANNSGDPIAQFDKQAHRWVMMQPVFTSPYALCVAVSQTSDATGAYNEYQFSIPSNYFPDYPKLAVWPDGYYVSYNAFQSSSGPFQGGYACSLNRSAILAGNSASMQCFNTGYPSLLPGDLDGDSGASGTTAAPPAASPDYFLDFYGSSVYLWKFHVDWTNSANTTLTGPTTVSGVAPFSAACGGGTCIPEPSGSVNLDSLADRLMYRLAYRNFGDHESLVISHSVSTGSGNVGVRWYEIRSPGTNPTVYQQGTFAPDSKYRWMPSAAMDEKGDIALGYSVSSSSSYPAIAYTARLSTDPLNTMETEAQIVQGTGGQTSYSRWGDYSAMTIDPNDDCTFWYTNEFHNVTGAFTWSTQIASFTLTGCTSPPTPDFSISASPTSQTVTAGGTTGAYTITITPSNGYTGNVALSIVGGLPNGATPTFTPSTVSSGSGTSSLTISTASNLAAGSYPLTVQGTDGTLTHTTAITLVVQTPDFSITGSPSSQTVSQGGSTSYTIGLTGSNGYSGSVTLSASGQPTGASVTFGTNPVSVSGSSAINSTMNVTTASNTPGGSYTITVTGTDATNNLIHSTTVTLVVQGPPPDFTIGASPLTLTVPPGSTGQYIVSIGAVNSFSGTVNFSVSGLPPRTSSSFNPSTVTGAGSTTLTISPNRRATNGTYPLTISGTSGSLTHSVNVTLVIGTVTTPDYSLSASPTSHTVTQGTGTTYSITATPSGGYIGNIALSASGNPANSTVSFNPASDNITSTIAVSSTMTVTTAASTPTGTYTITVTGKDANNLTHTTNVTLIVQSATQTGDFQITISPSSRTISKKQSVSYTVTITPSNGFTGNVSLTLATLPSGISGSLSPSTVTGGSGTSTLTLSAGGHPSTGTYMITVTGTSGSLTHPSTTQLIVQ